MRVEWWKEMSFDEQKKYIYFLPRWQYVRDVGLSVLVYISVSNSIPIAIYRTLVMDRNANRVISGFVRWVDRYVVYSRKERGFLTKIQSFWEMNRSGAKYSRVSSMNMCMYCLSSDKELCKNWWEVLGNITYESALGWTPGMWRYPWVIFRGRLWWCGNVES